MQHENNIQVIHARLVMPSLRLQKYFLIKPTGVSDGTGVTDVTIDNLQGYIIIR